MHYGVKKGRHEDSHIYRSILIRSILVKVLMNSVLTQFSPFYESQLFTTQFGFSGAMMEYISSSNSKKSHTSPIENCITARLTSQHHTTTSILIRNHFLSPESTECLHLTEELYQHTKSGRDPNTKIFSRRK